MDPAGGRFFLGLALASGDREPLARAVRRALGGDDAGRRYRLARAEGLHLTLYFLGALPEETRARLAAGLPGLADAPAPRLELEGTGAFPDESRARVLWVGVRGELERLATLHGRVLELVERVGLDTSGERARGYRPHVTVARPRRPGPVPADFRALAPRGGLPGDELRLFESLRGEGAARYEVRARVALTP